MSVANPLPAPRALSRALLAIGVAASFAAGRVHAQAECLGFLELVVAEAGTNGVEAVHAADLDDDGDVDLLTASYGDGRVFWYENLGLIRTRFLPHEISNDQPGASSVFSADIDGDGNVDVLSAARTTGRIAWFHAYREPGSPPAFQLRTITTAVGVPLAVFAADLDGDGDIDVLSAGFEDDTIAWYENDGASTPVFTAHDITTTADGAASVFAADVDGDGDQDVLSASRFDGAVTWHENDGAVDPVFTARSIGVAPGATSVIAADLDGDGDTDVAAASLTDDTVAWYDNQGGTPPTFTRHVVSTDGIAPVRVVAADVNGDGRQDLVSASRGDGTISWHANLGGSPPTFATIEVSTSAESAQSVYAADLDDDGDTDIVSTASVAGFPATRDEISWYENEGTPVFPEHSIFRSADGAVAAAAADFDGDGATDVASAGRSDKVAWYRNVGGPGPNFVEVPISSAVGGASAIQAVDFDGDLDFDLVSAGAESGLVAWHANDGTGSFVDLPISASEDGVQAIHVADIDADGHLDVLTALPDADTVAWLQSDGASPPAFTRRIVVDDAEGADGASAVHAGDVDGDGDLDVVVASAEDDTVAWFENVLGATPFPRHDVSKLAVGASAVLAVDLDADGDVDIVEGSAGDATLAWWQNDGAAAPMFQERIITQVAPGVSSVLAYDLDDDSDLDLVAAAPGNGSLFWFENNGATPPVFTPILVSVSGDGLTSVAVADIDGDNRPDLVAGQRLEVTWFRSTTEICQSFDASGDGRIDGVELAWLGRAFGLFSIVPVAEWWFAIDLDRNGIVDGDDLSILGSPGVFGESVSECEFVCEP